MNKLTLKTIKDSRIDNIDEDILDLIMNVKGVILAGGAVRDMLYGTPISDYDLFLTSYADIEQAKKYLENRGFVQTFACPLGHLFSYMKGEDFKKPEECIKAQIISKRRYHDQWDLIDSFDLSATYFALTEDEGTWDWKVHTSWEAIKDVRKKQLRLVNLEYPSSTINRLWKYRNKGYYVGNVIKEIVGRIAELDSYDPENDQLYID